MTSNTIRKIAQRLSPIFTEIWSACRAIFKKDFVVGLDIGTGSIKIAQFIKKDNSLYLIKVDLREIGDAEDDVSRQREISLALRELLQGVEVKKSKFIVTINCPRTVVKRIIAPYMPKTELREGVKLEAKNYFPFPIEEAILDFEILDEVSEKGIKKYQLLVATSPKATVYECLSILRKFSVKPSSIITVPVALEKLIKNSRPQQDKIQAFLDIGKSFSEIVIFKKDKLTFSHKIPVAGINFTKALTGALISEKGKIELSLDEAEKIKQEVGIPDESESKMAGNISTIQILSMLRPPIEQLASEVERCFDYYREESGGGRVESLTLFGGGASLKCLDKYLSEVLGIEVERGDSLKNINVGSNSVEQKKELLCRLAPAIGAALSEANGINLLPLEIKEEVKRTARRTTIEVVATVVILLSAFIYIGMNIQLSNFQKRISTAKLELRGLTPQLQETKMQSVIGKILANEPYWEDIFKELSNIVPNDIYLTELLMRDETIIMQGIAVSRDPETSISNFILTLEKGIFRDVKLITTKTMGEESAKRFELKCWVD